MFGLIGRLLRIVWRQESEGSGTAAPAAPPATPAATPAAHVGFIQAAGAEAQKARAQGRARQGVSRLLAARLQAVARLNTPVVRSRSKPASGPVCKPRPIPAPTSARRQVEPKAGVVLALLARPSPRHEAQIIDLAAARRSRRFETTHAELAVIFN